MNIIFNNEIVPLESRHRTILESLEAAGRSVRFQCRNGLCGCCRTRLKHGNIRYRQPKLGVTAEDEILICIASAENDLVLEQPE